MTDSLVITSEKDAVLCITLNRPERRNPLSSDMIAALSKAIESGNEDPNTRVIVIKATGPAFSAGHDLRSRAAIRRAATGVHAPLASSCPRPLTEIKLLMLWKEFRYSLFTPQGRIYTFLFLIAE